MTILLVAMRPERVTQKGEALLARLLDAGLRLIQGDPVWPKNSSTNEFNQLARLK